MLIVGFSHLNVLRSDNFLGNPGNKAGRGGELNTHKPGSIISCHLCACDQSQCLGSESVCVCASVLLLDDGVLV